MNVDDLTLGQIKELKGLIFGDVSNKPAPESEDWGWQIVILQRGWVMVGRIWKHGEYFKLRGGSVVRRWGTTMGLGQLAKEGPLKETILEPTPETTFHELVVIGMIECVKSKWL